MALTQVTSIGLKDGEIVNADLHSAASVALSKLASTGALGSAITATTQSASDDSTKLATTAFVQAAVTSLIDGAPGSLNTLNELAAAINDDSSYATTLTTALATKAVLTGSTNNTIATVTGANAIQGEANLTYDGTNFTQKVNSSTAYSSTATPQKGFQIQNEDDTTNSFSALRLTSGSSSPATAQISSIRTGTGQNDLAFQLETSNTAFEALRITSTGKVGINLTAPAVALDIQGGTSNTGIAVRSTDTRAIPVLLVPP